jgi:holo-[acyl-carrier protein] synthase
MILGTGMDIVSVERVRSLINSGGDGFLARLFGPEEIAYCQEKAKPWLHFAARLAAKEATAKALRLEWEGPPAWRDIQVRISASGAPDLMLKGSLPEKAKSLGIEALHVSLSHCDEYATASVVAEGDPPRPPTAPLNS